MTDECLKHMSMSEVAASQVLTVQLVIFSSPKSIEHDFSFQPQCDGPRSAFDMSLAATVSLDQIYRCLFSALPVSVCKLRLVRCPGESKLADSLKSCTNIAFLHDCEFQVEPLVYNAPCRCSYQEALYSATVHARSMKPHRWTTHMLFFE